MTALIIHEGKEITINIAGVTKVKVEDHLGTGGFADVWKVKDVSSPNYYVLKHVKINPRLDEKEKKDLVNRIKNEASIKIPSEYIVECLGLNELANNNFGLLFRFVPGQDLGEWMRTNKDLPWETKKKLFIKILRGVGDAHRLNILHRDLKPENILVTSGNQPQIIDFGLAKLKDKSITMTGDLKGTLPYMDPHALLSGIKYVDARCDIYAMGVCLHELIIGMHYWLAHGLEFPDFVRYVTSGKQNILEIDEGFSFDKDPTMVNVIRQSTMFDPEKRTRTINDLIVQMGASPVTMPDFDIDFTLSSPVLVVEDGSAKGSMNLITVSNESERELGRLNLDATNDTISKTHAVIYRKDNKYFLYDTGSKNGTYHNGSRIGIGRDHMVEIKHTDRIRFGDLWTRFVFLKK